MSAKTTPLLHLGRAGGTPPRDDEVLDVAADGTWTARRTVGGRRVGRFAGTMDDRVLGGMRRDVERAVAAGEARVETPHHGATETVEAGGATLLTGSNEDPPAGWRPLVRRARTFLLEDAIGGPVAALELVADLATARLTHAGTEPVEVDPSSVAVRVGRVGPDGGRLDDWARGSGGEEPGWVTAGPGWNLELPFAHGLEPRPGDVLQVRVELRVRDAGVRRVRLYVPVRA